MRLSRRASLVFFVLTAVCLIELLLIALNAHYVCIVQQPDDDESRVIGIVRLHGQWPSKESDSSDEVVKVVDDVTDSQILRLRSIVERLNNGLDFRTTKRSRLSKAKSARLARYGRQSSGIIPFHRLLEPSQFYSDSEPDTQILENLLKTLATEPITSVEEIESGTQIKLNLTLSDGTRALLKPARSKERLEANPNHYYFSDFERHVAEIGAHHLDRLLGFRRVPPVAGRFVNVTHDIKRLADDYLHRTFFQSPVGNTCFQGHCKYYCDSGHAICGDPDMIEASMAVYLPPSSVASRTKWRHPWRRSYSKHRKAYWETDPDYCSNVTSSSPYNVPGSRRMLDLMDMAVFDFLISNLDRHHYETFDMFGDDAFTIMLDNGRGFGISSKDDLSILAPLRHCCLIRLSTVLTLLRYDDGPLRLSDTMRSSLSRDKLPTVLTERHLAALDRRVRRVLATVLDCVTSHLDDVDIIGADVSNVLVVDV